MQRTTTFDLAQRLSLDESRFAVDSREHKEQKEKDEKKSVAPTKPEKETKALAPSVENKEEKISAVAKQREKNDEDTAYKIMELKIKHICSLSLNPDEKELANMIEYLKAEQTNFIAECIAHPRLAALYYANCKNFRKDVNKKLAEDKYQFNALMAKLGEIFDSMIKALQPAADAHERMIEKQAKEEAKNNGRAYLLKRLKDYQESENNRQHQSILSDYFEQNNYSSVLEYITENFSALNIPLCDFILKLLDEAQNPGLSDENTTLLAEISIIVLNAKATQDLSLSPQKEGSKGSSEKEHKEKKDDWVMVKSKPEKPSMSIDPYAPSSAQTIDSVAKVLREMREKDEAEDEALNQAIQMSLVLR